MKNHKAFLYYAPKSAKKTLLILALFVGAIIYKGLLQIFNMFVSKTHGMKPLSNFDDFFLVDERKAILGGYLRAEKFDFDKMSNYLKEKLCKNGGPFGVRLIK